MGAADDLNLMMMQAGRILILLNANLQELFSTVLYGYELEYFDSLETARQALTAKQFDLVMISNLGFRPGDAVDLIPHDHAYSVLFYSGFMDSKLAARCQAKRIRWCPVPIAPRMLLAEVVRALSTQANKQGCDT